MATFRFRFSPLYRILGAPFGVTPGTAQVRISEGRFEVHFGPWGLSTPVENLVRAELTGPYSIPKTAGPAHLSLADRGITFATNRKSGICFEFASPVPAIDPLGIIRHPNVTLTVERPAELERAVLERLEGEELEMLSDGGSVESPWSLLRRWVSWPPGMLVAAVRHFGIVKRVARTTRSHHASPHHSKKSDLGKDAQTQDLGVGPMFDRSYRVHIARSKISPEKLMEFITSNFNDLAPTEVAEFSEMERPRASSRKEYLVRMPGPWNGPVRVVESTPTRVLLQTLDGHMEAGQIEFSTRIEGVKAPDEETWNLVFEIRSHARSGDGVFAFLYERLLVAREMQLHMWVHFCDRVVEVSGGERVGDIEADTLKSRG